MSKARQIVPGRTHGVTRRCLNRRYGLKPSKKTDRIIRYCLAVAALRYGMAVHAYIFLSNHYHLTVTDVHGVLPDFEQYLNSLLARALNASRGDWETFWAPNSYVPTWCATKEAVMDSMVYARCNAVSSFLVEKAHHWPGVISSSLQFKRPMKCKRPPQFFSKEGNMPKEAELKLVPPPSFDDMELDEFIDEFDTRCTEREKDLVANAKRNGKAFLGRKAIMKQHHKDVPTTKAPRRKIRPRVKACNNAELRRAIAELKRFDYEYDEAKEAYRAGDKDVVFPYGTYWMRVHVNVRCASP